MHIDIPRIDIIRILGHIIALHALKHISMLPLSKEVTVHVDFV